MPLKRRMKAVHTHPQLVTLLKILDRYRIRVVRRVAMKGGESVGACVWMRGRVLYLTPQVVADGVEGFGESLLQLAEIVRQLELEPRWRRPKQAVLDNKLVLEGVKYGDPA